jgi:hypothetical protein
MEISSVLEAAIAYSTMGLCVIPLHGKKPYWENWPEVATTNKDQIRKWWTQEPRANVGIATGRKSNVFVVDIDPKNGGQDSAETWFSQHGRFPDTWKDITGSGGSHYYFRYPSFPVGNKVGLLPGIDIRGDGGQVVAPPSVHPDTKKIYVWDGLTDPWDDLEGLAEAPAWLLELLHPQERERGKVVSVPMQIPKGVQHQTLVSLAGNLRRLGLTACEMTPTLLEVNRNRCQEPGAEQNIRKIAESMMRYQPAERNLYSTAVQLWRLTRHAEKEQQEVVERMRPVDAWELIHKEIEPIKEIVEGLLHNGATILAGPPKAGKSWMTLGLAIGVACGGRFLSSKKVIRPGRVSYFALEETERRTAGRLKMLLEHEDIALQNIEFLYSLKPMGAGGLAELDQYIGQANPTLVIIDTLMAFVTGESSSRRDVFRQDYQELKAIQELAGKHDTAILVVHHTNKIGGSGLQAVAGTHGVTAAVDSIWTVQRQPQRRAILKVEGREVEEQNMLIELELKQPIGWFVVEEGEAAESSRERQEIMFLLRESDDGMGPKELCAQIRGKSEAAVKMLLRRMMAEGLIIKNGRGKYTVVGKALKGQGNEGNEWVS